MTLSLAVPPEEKGFNMSDKLSFIDEDGHQVLASDWHGRIILLVFLRWLG